MLLGLQVQTVTCAGFSNIRVKDQVFTPDAPGPLEEPLRGSVPRKYVGMSDETMTFAPSLCFAAKDQSCSRASRRAVKKAVSCGFAAKEMARA